jgi:hypothetical protein
MGKQIYEGPYGVSGVYDDNGYEPTRWEVLYKWEMDGTPYAASLNPEQIYPHRQSAYRRAATLNQQWAEKQVKRGEE